MKSALRERLAPELLHHHRGHDLGLEKTAPPKELYDALVKRYNDPEEGAGKGSLSTFWEPIPISKYLNPRDFYKPPEMVDADATRQQCVECHTQTSPGWVHSWQKSVHVRSTI